MVDSRAIVTYMQMAFTNSIYTNGCILIQILLKCIPMGPINLANTGSYDGLV